jgi:hypothetical protein
MVRRFQKKIWTLAGILAVDVCFQVQSLGIQIDRVAEPAKVRGVVKQLRSCQRSTILSKLLLRQGSPNAPAEGLIASHHGNLDEAPNEEILLLNWAEVRIKKGISVGP